MAGYVCTEDKCALRILCAGHATAHKMWGHVVMADNGVLSPGAAGGVSHCDKPEHAGAEGVFTLYCTTCSMLVCRACGDEHLSMEHVLVTVQQAAGRAVQEIEETLPLLQKDLMTRRAQTGAVRDNMDRLDEDRARAVDKVAEAVATVHAHVDAVGLQLVQHIGSAFDTKMALLQSQLQVARASVAELETVVECASFALGSSGSDALVKIHVAKTVKTTASAGGCGVLADEGVPEQNLTFFPAWPSSVVDAGVKTALGHLQLSPTVCVLLTDWQVFFYVLFFLFFGFLIPFNQSGVG